MRKERPIQKWCRLEFIAEFPEDQEELEYWKTSLNTQKVFLKYGLLEEVILLDGGGIITRIRIQPIYGLDWQ